MNLPAKYSRQCWNDLLWMARALSLVNREHRERHNVQMFGDIFRHTIANLPADPPAHMGIAWSNFLSSLTQRRVGRYFEQLVQFFLEHVAQVDLLAAGKQIQHNGRTIGEIDFLFKDAAGQVCHLETAVKFFLRQPTTPVNGSLLPGPNPTDNFESKLTRLFQHQLPLSRRLPLNVTRRTIHWVGIIFEPLDADRGQTHRAMNVPGLSKNHHSGLWLKSDQISRLRDLCSTADSRMVLRSKPFWLGDILSDSASCEEIPSVAQSIAELERHFRQSDRPIMASVLAPPDDRSRIAFEETSRVVIVPSKWPDGH